MRHRVLFRAGWRHILDTWLGEHQPWEWVRLSDWMKEIHCVVETEWKFISVWCYDFLFYFLFCFFLCSLDFFRIK